ncbi:MAG: arylsulfatase, partial [Planctomycetota bacterium]|nr:arylsulfatase [Planctomycetota bacterium]
PEKPIRSHLILAPNKRTHLSVRRGKWMFIPSQDSGGFTGRKPGDHTFAGPPAATFVGSVNSDIENGKIKPDAPPAQLYDLENDRLQTRNLYREHPEVVKEMRALLQSQAPKSDSRSRPPVKSQAKTKYDQFKPLGNLRFAFESGKLEGWTIIEGAAGRPVSDHASLPRHKSRPYNHEGKFHLSTIATADGFSDKQKVVFQSPKFVIQGDRASFLASGGFEPGTLYVGLLDADSKEVLLSAGGPRGPQMMRTTWDVSKLKGKTVFLQVVDRSIAGWGHLTFDDFSVEGKLRTDGATKSGQAKPQ